MAAEAHLPPVGDRARCCWFGSAILIHRDEIEKDAGESVGGSGSARSMARHRHGRGLAGDGYTYNVAQEGTEGPGLWQDGAPGPMSKEYGPVRATTISSSLTLRLYLLLGSITD